MCGHCILTGQSDPDLSLNSINDALWYVTAQLNEATFKKVELCSQSILGLGGLCLLLVGRLSLPLPPFLLFRDFSRHLLASSACFRRSSAFLFSLNICKKQNFSPEDKDIEHCTILPHSGLSPWQSTIKSIHPRVPCKLLMKERYRILASGSSLVMCSCSAI